MKALITYILMLFSFCCIAQSITSAEYFFNTDPGVGSGIALAVNANSGQLIQSYAISTSGLGEGFHSLYIRTKNDENNWSLYHRQVIYVKTFATSNITAAEYFFNTDPGVGGGIALAVNANSGQLTQSYSISTSSLGEGFHSFYIRTKDTNSKWSLFHRQVIYIKDFDLIPDDVTTAEYFIDTDPGIGFGTAIVFGDASQTTQILNVDTTGLAEGDHVFYIRVKTLNGAWSIYDSALFSVNALGLEDSLFKTTSIYPNPFVDTINIGSSNNLIIEKLAVYDMNGKIVYSKNSNSKKIDLKFLTTGIYILRLKANNSEATFKIVKQ
jgi:Secretion system C-terminal sorting domain